MFSFFIMDWKSKMATSARHSLTGGGGNVLKLFFFETTEPFLECSLDGPLQHVLFVLTGNPRLLPL